MAEIREKVRLTNLADTLTRPQSGRKRKKIRSLEVEAVVDTGAVMSVIPIHIVQKLGLEIRARRLARYADGRTDDVGITSGVLFEIQGRDTIEEALVLGDQVLIGQTVLEKLDLLADSAGRRVLPNPERPNQPVIMIR